MAGRFVSGDVAAEAPWGDGMPSKADEDFPIIKRCLSFCARLALIILLTASAAWAQATAQLSGTVRDESGAVLPGVTVTATQTNTDFVRTAVTEGDGAGLLTNLPIGPY